MEHTAENQSPPAHQRFECLNYILSDRKAIYIKECFKINIWLCAELSSRKLLPRRYSPQHCEKNPNWVKPYIMLLQFLSEKNNKHKGSLKSKNMFGFMNVMSFVDFYVCLCKKIFKININRRLVIIGLNSEEYKVLNLDFSVSSFVISSQTKPEKSHWFFP